ncbi:MAG: hypothetical protein AAF899_14950 [Pseudomonadota bacterium]
MITRLKVQKGRQMIADIAVGVLRVGIVVIDLVLAGDMLRPRARRQDVTDDKSGCGRR